MPEKPAQYSYTILPTFNHSSSIPLCLCFTDSALQTVQLRFIEWIDKITGKAEADQIAQRKAEVSYTFYVAAGGAGQITAAELPIATGERQRADVVRAAPGYG